MYRIGILSLVLILGVSYAHSQNEDLVSALRQQREEAQDKLVNAYVTIMRLQRELDKIKAEDEKKVKGLESPK
jgi:hypothetical protein